MANTDETLLKKNLLKQSKFREHSWIVYKQLDEIVSDTKIFTTTEDTVINNINLSANSCEYIYLAVVNSKIVPDETGGKIEIAKLLSIVQDNNKYYLIRHCGERNVPLNLHINNKPEKYKITSAKITVGDTLLSIIMKLSSIERKIYNLKSVKNTKNDNDNININDNLNGIDFINNWNNNEKLTAFINNSGETVDFSTLLMLQLKSSTFDNLLFDKVNTIILNQNVTISDLNFIKSENFPNLKTLSVWSCQTILDNLLDFDTNNIKIENLEFHNCKFITGRSLLNILKLNNLKKLLFDNEYMLFQKTTFKMEISDEEWKNINNESLKMFIINSHNFTLDFMQKFIESCKNLSQIIVSGDVFNNVIKNVRSGYNDTEISIINYDNTSIFKTFKRDLVFRELLKNKYDSKPYSDSMLKIINKNINNGGSH